MFTFEFYKEYFKQCSNRGYHIAFKSHPKPIKKAKRILTTSLFKSHIEGKITLYLTPVYKGECSWAVIDIDVLSKGEVLQLEQLNTVYNLNISTLNFVLKKLGLESNEYLLLLNGRGMHLFFFFKKFIPSEYAFDFINTVKENFEFEYDQLAERNKFSIELRPAKPDGDKKCIQLPGKNQIANRFSIPLIFSDCSILLELKVLPTINKLGLDKITSIIMEFAK